MPAVSARNSKLKSATTPQELESRYRKIFETAEVGLWEEDYSQVKAELDLLRQRGVSDFRDYFSRNPQEVIRLAGLIRVLDANAQALKLVIAVTIASLLPDGKNEGPVYGWQRYRLPPRSYGDRIS